MGVILDLPAAAGPFHAEARRESFYVGAGSTYDDDRRLTAASGHERGAGTFAVKRDDLPAFLAALDEVSLRPESLGAAAADSDPWTVTLQDTEIVVSGPMYTYGVGGTVRELTQSVELMYADLGYLRQRLAVV